MGVAGRLRVSGQALTPERGPGQPGSLSVAIATSARAEPGSTQSKNMTPNDASSLGSGNGWNGTTVEVGNTVQVWAEHFGRGVRAVVRELNGGFAVVEIVQTAKRCSFAAGNKVTVGVWWLEAVA